MRDELDPVKTFNHLARNWWKIVIIAVICGLLGLAISFILPSKYEAEAVFHASIDFTQINFKRLVGQYGEPIKWTQYEEDLALQVVERVMKKKLVDTFFYAETLDPNLDIETFRKDYKISRYLGQWYFRYRHQDPEIAQKIVNFWSENGYELLEVAKEIGVAESFVIIDFVSKAELPQSPVYNNRGTLVLAGTMIGFIAGIIWLDFNNRYLAARLKEA